MDEYLRKLLNSVKSPDYRYIMQEGQTIKISPNYLIIYIKNKIYMVDGRTVHRMSSTDIKFGLTL